MTGEIITVVPLDLVNLRKTQRRVAALLCDATNPDLFLAFKPRHRKQVNPFYSRSRLNPYEKLLNDAALRHPKAPNPSVCSSPDVTYRSNSQADDPPYQDTDDVFNTAVLRGEVLEDPRRFTLPPVFNSRQGGVGTAWSIVPTISENSFIAASFNNSTTNGRHGNRGEITRLPVISKGSNLVSINSNGESDRGDHDRSSPLTARDGRKPPGYLDLALTSRSDPGIERNGTYESEKTSGSLRTDEDYIPMSITIKNYTGAVIQTSRQPSLATLTETTEVISDHSTSPTDFMTRLQSASWCECRTMTSGSAPCPECRALGGHEKWCVSARDICNQCLKPIKRRSKRRQRHDVSRDPIDTHDLPDSMIASHPSMTSTSSPNYDTVNKTEKPKRPKNSNSRRRVHFDDAVLDQNGLELSDTSSQSDNNSNTSNNSDDSSYNNTNKKQDKENRNSTKVKTDNHSSTEAHATTDNLLKSGVSTSSSHNKTKVPQPPADVHKTAYILALRDAREQMSNKIKRDITGQNGTIFSYFPLLKSHQGKITDIGLKQKQGAKNSNGMKHIFGNLNMADYYPGGSRWREI